MNRMLVNACVLAIASLTVACSQQAGGTRTSDNVAVVDGVAIKRTTYMEYVKSVTNTPWEKLSEQQRSGLLENLIQATLLTKQADATGLASQETTRGALELARLNVLSQFVTEDYKATHKPSEAELHAEYEAQVASMDKAQYRASHILVSSEEAARQIIAQLKAGGNFAQIARKESLDTGSKESGGALDWFAPGSMTPSFADAVRALKKGETSTMPVRSEFGWHVIRVTDIRETPVPAYDEVKARVEELVHVKKLRTYVQELLAKAKITRSL